MFNRNKKEDLNDLKQMTKTFLERFEKGGQTGFSATSGEILIIGKYLKKVGNDMGIEDNFELLKLFAGLYQYWKMKIEFAEWHEQITKEIEEKYKKDSN